MPVEKLVTTAQVPGTATPRGPPRVVTIGHVEPDLDAIERQLAEAESTLERLDDGSYWTDRTGTMDRTGDATADVTAEQAMDGDAGDDTIEQALDDTPMHSPAPAPTER